MSTPSNMNVIVGSTRQDGRGGIPHRVSIVFTHPDYIGADQQLIADIAVVRTVFAISFTSNVRPITLGPNNVIGANERVTIPGWGLLGNSNNDNAEQLHVLDMTTISNSQCTSMHRDLFTRDWITSEKLCTVGLNSRASSGICAGDR